MENNNYYTKTEFVFETLKKKIISGELEPQRELIINNLSKEFSVSPIPVREALKMLESDGLVDIEPHKTAKVSAFSEETLRQIITIRAGLEGYAARLAVSYINEVQYQALDSIVQDMINAVKKGNTESFSTNNLKFHRELYQIPPYPMLYEMIVKVWDRSKWTKSVFAINSQRMKRSIDEHKEILKAIKDGDEDKVEKLIREHRINAGKELEIYFQK